MKSMVRLKSAARYGVHPDRRGTVTLSDSLSDLIRKQRLLSGVAPSGSSLAEPLDVTSHSFRRLGITYCLFSETCKLLRSESDDAQMDMHHVIMQD
ncbi:hypothetical protein Agabi119p4_2595 [Agaricus bisporus var. burnettii]|uniref:Uncharacterized protein n=1 Tax=Agaricus bisporus var. burnettii TaxID=192524 RepID=A0A8H7F9T1_AGABI|nr:hypothetical protein Agabi119p4_2595 [Agaricus bisporus var. burnettii]